MTAGRLKTRQWILLILGMTVGFSVTHIYNMGSSTSKHSRRNTRSSAARPGSSEFADPADMVTFSVDYRTSRRSNMNDDEAKKKLERLEKERQKNDYPKESQHQNKLKSLNGEYTKELERKEQREEQKRQDALHKEVSVAGSAKKSHGEELGHQKIYKKDPVGLLGPSLVQDQRRKAQQEKDHDPDRGSDEKKKKDNNHVHGHTQKKKKEESNDAKDKLLLKSSSSSLSKAIKRVRDATGQRAAEARARRENENKEKKDNHHVHGHNKKKTHEESSQDDSHEKSTKGDKEEKLNDIMDTAVDHRQLVADKNDVDTRDEKEESSSSLIHAMTKARITATERVEDTPLSQAMSQSRAVASQRVVAAAVDPKHPNLELHKKEKLTTYVRDDKLVGDVSGLLDFAIVGFSKSATTHVMAWLRQQEDYISIGRREMCSLNRKEGAKLVEHLLDLDATKLRGLKCPGHFTRTSLDWYRQHFYKTKLIIGLRHPVKWFESFYNFRVRHPKYRNAILPDAEQMIGRCTREMQGVCTQHAKFHQQLARLGKTDLNSAEQVLLQMDSGNITDLQTHRLNKNPVFLYEISQMSNPQVAADLGQFLGLPGPLKPYVDEKEEKDDGDKSKLISLCDPKYDLLRQELMQTSVAASDWILGYLLDRVQVSARESFVTAVQGWKQDPCVAKSS